MRILFTGGGTGGHIFPIMAVKSTFAEATADKFYYLGPDGFVKENLIGIKNKFISAGKFRRYFSLTTPIDLLKIFVGIIQSLWHLFLIMPDVIFSKGGYGSFPVCFVGWIYRIPIVLHDSDSAPGLANRVMAKFAKKIILSFKSGRKYFKPKHQSKIILIGNPIRKELLCERQTCLPAGRELFKISATKPVILIIGGSQGAQKINENVLNILPRLLEMTEVIHVSGKNNFKETNEQAKDILGSHENLKPYYHLYPFLDAGQLKHAYAVADLILNRAGAGSIFEIAALGKPSILIPLPNSAQDHQRKNAYEFSNSGARTVVLDQENLTPNILLDTILNLLSSPTKLQEMGQKAKSFYNLQTPELIRDEILKLIKGHA
jgi:UDP-N-acetylglucosamine--N-acetylmuramyl-(pentapeptide) pyrophosphoryl-undecaprenol N-acetylglucosamine transferase